MTEIEISVSANSKQNKVIESDTGLKVFVTTAAVDNKANKAVIKLLASHLNLRKSRISIVRGIKSKKKLIKIDEA